MLIILLLLLSFLIYIFVIISDNENFDENNFEIPIYDNKNINIYGYNIGDLLNMPSFWAGWKRNPHNTQEKYNSYLKVSKNYPKTIVYYYSQLRIDSSEKIPNIPKIEDAVDLFIKNNNVSILINKVNNNNILCVHLRSGDKGIVEDEYINKINILANKYKKIIILSGIHSDETDSTIENSKLNLIRSLKKIKNNKVEIHMDTPDNHLVMMRNAKNLLIHKGGFSILGSLIFNGNNLYYTRLFEPRNNNEIIDHINNKKINYIEI